ncbi:hypothetical protein [Actinoplanes couchii]|uniref:Helix-turn-helix domain-containing protein n=1 Tax=Actinoplanes couchii TaxID=403638 RepID=A0ABQ3XTS4_9ACTN|nr:hypothetical protein [Actinoplanes couchii]MDR6318937.1 hypothetical protein [Actinoplanes couchii]GID61845.1 hypothetical protein Aco03nite_102490 [Actinoplanes couchii]
MEINGKLTVTVREWTDILARIRFGTVTVAGKNYSAARIKLVAHRLANYADSDGTRIHPGIARLAVDLEIEYRTARDAVALLRRLGLIHLVRRATARGRADEYRLTLPLDLLDRDDLDVWTPDRHILQTQQLRDRHCGASRTVRRPQDPTPPPPPASATPGPQDPTTTPGTDDGATSPGTSEPVPAGSSRTATHGPHAPTTYQDHNTTPTDHNTPGVSATLTTAPEPAPPQRCEHGLSTALRPDGQITCTICRVLERRTTIVRRPSGDGILAPHHADHFRREREPASRPR